jgi:hypothetical protein
MGVHVHSQFITVSSESQLPPHLSLDSEQAVRPLDVGGAWLVAWGQRAANAIHCTEPPALTGRERISWPSIEGSAYKPATGGAEAARWSRALQHARGNLTAEKVYRKIGFCVGRIASFQTSAVVVRLLQQQLLSHSAAPHHGTLHYCHVRVGTHARIVRFDACKHACSGWIPLNRNKSSHSSARAATRSHTRCASNQTVCRGALRIVAVPSCKPTFQRRPQQSTICSSCAIGE